MAAHKNDGRTISMGGPTVGGANKLEMINATTDSKASAGPVRMRTMSLSNKPDSDPMELVNRAVEVNKNPIKLSWHNVFFEVDVEIQDEERLLNPELG